MLAKSRSDLPQGEGWLFEPKWDGFRALVFRDGDEILLQSRDVKPLGRYFPELLAPLKAQLPEKCVVDGELVIANGTALDFEALQLRLHPAASRVNRLAAEMPASIVLWDILCEGDRSLLSSPFTARRALLQSVLVNAKPPVYLTPATDDRDVAADWFRRFEGAGLDGVIAKPASGTYEPNKRVMFKVKHERDCDCVVGGFRWHKGGTGTAVGSLLLGLYDDTGSLQHVGVSASFTMEKRRELVTFLAPYREDALASHPWAGWAGNGDDESGDEPRRRPGGQSRWSQGKDLSWQPLRPELVVQVAYDHMQGHRFRHTAQFRRWRTDKAPAGCTFAQLEVVPPHELAEIFASGRCNPAAAATRASDRRPGPASPAAGGSSSGTWRRLTRMRVHVDERPRIESTSTSSTARCAAASGCLAFHRSRPASAASLSGELATTTSGIFARGVFAALLRARRRDARRLPIHLAEVRRPGRIAETRRLVARRELEQPLERPGRLVHRCVRIADGREALRHRQHREVRRIARRHLVPA